MKKLLITLFSIGTILANSTNVLAEPSIDQIRSNYSTEISKIIKKQDKKVCRFLEYKSLGEGFDACIYHHTFHMDTCGGEIEASYVEGALPEKSIKILYLNNARITYQDLGLIDLPHDIFNSPIKVDESKEKDYFNLLECIIKETK